VGLQRTVASVLERVDIPCAHLSSVPVAPSPSAPACVTECDCGRTGKGRDAGERLQFLRNVERRIMPTAFDMGEQGLLPVCDIPWERLKSPWTGKNWV